jgi:hypothetical protein
VVPAGKGWAKLKAIDEWVRNRLRYCIWKQWKKPNRRMKNFIRLDVIPNIAYAWSRSRNGRLANRLQSNDENDGYRGKVKTARLPFF